MNRDSPRLHVLAAAGLALVWVGLLIWVGHALLSSWALAGVCFGIMRATPKPKLRALWFNLGTVLTLVGAFTGYVESQSSFLENEQEMVTVGVTNDAGGLTRLDRFVYDGQLVYDVVYTEDRDQLRVGPAAPPPTPSSCVLFFGCSFAFGVGVNDDQTLAHQSERLANGRFRSRNFGRPGTGPHHMLEQLQSGFVERVAGCEPKYAVYEAITDHVNRAGGRLIASGDWFGPRYVLSAAGRPLRHGDIKRYYAQWPTSKVIADFTQWLDRTLYDPVRPEHVDLFFALIAESRRELQARYPGIDLAVVYWDREASEHNPQLVEALRARGDANLHLVSQMLPPRPDWLGAYQLPYDFHPTALANQLLAEHLVEQVLPE